MTDAADLAAEKTALRARLQAARTALTEAERDRRNALFGGWLAACAESLRGQVVAAYVPLPDEPGTVRLLVELEARAATVLLPVTGRMSEPLRWGRFTTPDALLAGPAGLRQPPADPGLHPGLADLVVVPALAVDGTGYRLGKGAGHYDRALAGLPTERTTALVYDEEVLARVPREQHDRPVGWICTPEVGRRRVTTG